MTFSGGTPRLSSILMNAAVIKMLDSLGVPPENVMLDDFGG